MRHRGYLAVIAAAAAIFFLAGGCGNSSEVGNPGLAGGLIDGRDGTPAAGAVVRVYPVYSGQPRGAVKKSAGTEVAVDSVWTDRNGRYRFADLDEGVYSVAAMLIDERDTLYMRHPTVLFTDARDLGWDTLLLPGSIKGVVSVPDFEIAQGITCYLPGTSHVAFADSLGMFRISGVPQGIHRVAFHSDRFNDTTVQNVVVRSGEETDVGTVALRLDRIKNEHNVRGVFDTNCAVIGRIEARITGDDIQPDQPRVYSLDWRPQFGWFSGYVLFPSRGDWWIVSVWVYDTLDRRIGVCHDTVNRSTGDIEMPRFDPCNAVPVISLNDTMASIFDTVRIVPRTTVFHDDSVVLTEWKIGDSGTFTPSSSMDTTIIAPADSTVIPCTFRVTGKFGAGSSRRILVTVDRDAPTLDLGPDTTRILGSSVTLTAWPQQRFGSIVMYSWEFRHADSTWTDSGAGLFARRLSFTMPGELSVVCRVRDDDGNRAADTLVILVVSDLTGVLDSNLTLMKIGSPYRVSNVLIVPGRLTIEPGTTVLLDVGAVMTVYGVLDAEGLDADRITIMNNSADVSSRLGMIRIMAGATCRLRYCDLQNGQIVNEDGTNPAEVTIDQCQLHNVAARINAPSGQRVAGVIKNCRIVHSDISINCDKWLFMGNSFARDRGAESSCRLFLSGRDLALLENRLTGAGLIVEGSGEVLRDTIESATTTGLSVTARYGGGWTITGNVVSGNGGSGIVAKGEWSETMEGNRITGNVIEGNAYGESPGEYPFYHAGIVCLDSLGLIDSNTITDNTIGAICRAGSVTRWNNLYGNRTYDFRVPSISDSARIDLANNWWGIVDTVEIRRKIFDPGSVRTAIDPVAADSIRIQGAPVLRQETIFSGRR
ncbi:MAG: hypothetical protein JXA71_10710 [Chitinispirillaceae bacterium]|nr:hypothetical protein [Chitinispirillaceae bacterium]